MIFTRLRIEVEETPNPNARKFTTNRMLNDGPTRSYRSREMVGDDPLAVALFEIPHVVGVMILGDFCTVNKSSKGRWATITPKVKTVLKKHM